MTEMLPLYHEPHFTFRFAHDRIIPRFHLPVTGGRLNRIASATTADGGWVDLAEPIMVRAGNGFVAVPVEGT